MELYLLDTHPEEYYKRRNMNKKKKTAKIKMLFFGHIG
jgi:hypothetical protein